MIVFAKIILTLLVLMFCYIYFCTEDEHPVLKLKKVDGKYQINHLSGKGLRW